MKFSIITPTLLRTTIMRTAHSLINQSHQDWEWLLMLDTKINETNSKILNDLLELKDNRIKIMFYPNIPCGYPGSKIRNLLWDYATGDYLLYIDDDDYYALDCFEILNSWIPKDSIWGVFPANRFGGRFFHVDKIQSCLISGVQFYHAKYNGDIPLKWFDQTVGLDDWRTIANLLHYKVDIYPGKELVYIDKVSGGAVF